MSGHNAMIYGTDDEFVTGVSGFVHAGLETGERVMVVAPAEKLHRLEATLGAALAHVDMRDAEAVYRPQTRVMQVTLDYLGEQPTRPTRLVAEQALAARRDLEVAAYLRQEAAANASYARFPVTVLCPYDAAGLPARVLDACRKTHPGLLESGQLTANGDYLDPRAYLTQEFDVPVPPSRAATFTCESVDDLVVARRLVQGEAAKAQLGWDTAGDLVLAVNEVLTNALTHGRPPARLYVYREGPALACHVHDLGPGFIDPLAGYLPPPREPTSGRGLWLARQLCDSVEIGRDAAGSHVRLLMLPDG